MTTIIQPALAMVALTFMVWCYMYFKRLSFIRVHSIDPQSVATRALGAKSLAAVSAPSDNLMNLFELPVLFYVLVRAAAGDGRGEPGIRNRRVGVCRASRASQLHPLHLQPGPASLHRVCRKLDRAVGHVGSLRGQAPVMMLQGGCFCGRVRYEVKGELFNRTNCHCSICRRTSGAPFVTWFTVAQGNFHWLSGQPAAFESSPGVTRAFCRDCGTALTFARSDHRRRNRRHDLQPRRPG